MKRLARTKLRSPSGLCRKALLHAMERMFTLTRYNQRDGWVQPGTTYSGSLCSYLVASASFSFPATIVLHGSEYHGDPAMNDGLSSPFTLHATNFPHQPQLSHSFSYYCFSRCFTPFYAGTNQDRYKRLWRYGYFRQHMKYASFASLLVTLSGMRMM